MNQHDLIRTIEAIIIITGIGGVIYALFKNTAVKATITSQKDLIETLSAQVKELRQLHIDNEKAIAKLTGQIEVYKELPLIDLAESMKQLSVLQEKILIELKKGRK